MYLVVGDCVPADLRLFDVNELAVDERGFTGESVAKYKTIDVLPSGNGALDICDMNTTQAEMQPESLSAFDNAIRNVL